MGEIAAQAPGGTVILFQAQRLFQQLFRAGKLPAHGGHQGLPHQGRRGGRGKVAGPGEALLSLAHHAATHIGLTLDTQDLRPLQIRKRGWPLHGNHLIEFALLIPGAGKRYLQGLQRYAQLPGVL